MPTLLRLAWPNILVMLAQAYRADRNLVGIASRHGFAAGMALVFPVVMLMQMVSAGAMGGGISSAVARALGAGRRDEADALVLHAVMVNVALGAFFSIVMLVFGPSIYRVLGGTDGELRTALSYANVVFAGNVLLWLMNGLASVIRGTGNMMVPAMVICAGVIVLVPLSPFLIFGVGPFPGLAWPERTWHLSSSMRREPQQLAIHSLMLLDRQHRGALLLFVFVAQLWR